MPMLVRVAKVAEVPLGTCHEVKASRPEGTLKILLCNVGGTIHAIGAKCPHMGLPLAKGDFDGREVTCHYHGAKIDVTTGKMTAPPCRAEWSQGSFARKLLSAFGKLKKPKEGCGAYRVEIRGDYVWLALDQDREAAPADLHHTSRTPDPATP